MKIRFITDGNNHLGLGHIYQSKTFANYIREKQEYDPEIIFLTQSSEEIASIIRNEGYQVIQFESDDLMFQFLERDNPDVIIFDKLDIDPLFAKRIKDNLAARLAIFTCITEANKYADVSVMGAMGSHFENVVTSNCGIVHYNGPKYLILRPEFFNLHQCSETVKQNKGLVVTLLFGGADPAGLTCAILKELFVVDDIARVNVIIGNAFKDLDELNNIQKGILPFSCQILKNISNVEEILSSSDLAIVSPGISFFEALRCGTPVIIFSQNNFQQKAWEDDIETHTKEHVRILKSIIINKNFIFPSDNRVIQMQIGEGVNELITTILSKS